MSAMIIREDSITELEEYIDKYDQIIIFDDNNENIRKLKNNIVKSKILKKKEKKVLLMGMHILVEKVSNVSYRQITEEEFDAVMCQYRTYEFTDKLRIISDSCQFGSMLNYILTGVLTQEEYFEALLC